MIKQTVHINALKLNSYFNAHSLHGLSNVIMAEPLCSTFEARATRCEIQTEGGLSNLAMLTSAVLIPVLSWISLNAATCVLLTIPVPGRLYYILATLIPATTSFATIQHLSFIHYLSELWGAITLIGLIHFSTLLYIKKCTLRPPQQAGKVSKTTETWLDQKMWTRRYKIALNPRFIRVLYKDVVLPEQHSGSQIKSTAIHRKFSLTRIPWLLLKIGSYLLLNRLAITRILGRISIGGFTPAKTVLLRRLLRSSINLSNDPTAKREIAMRIWLTVNTIWTPILLLDSFHTALAVLFIYVLHIDIPDDWPDLFGSPLEAFTLSQCWGTYVYMRPTSK